MTSLSFNKIAVGILVTIIVTGVSFNVLADTGRQTRQFNSAEANEAYQLAKNCLDKNGYSEGDTIYSAKYSLCLPRVQEILDNIGKENNQCLSQCITNKPGSTNCDTCVQHYSEGGYTERTYSACDSFCVAKSPGQCGQCFDLRDQKKKEVTSAVEAAFEDWEAAHKEAAPPPKIEQTKIVQPIIEESKIGQPATVETPNAAIAPAKYILSKPDRIDLSGVQSTGVNTSSLQNIKDIAEGKCASTGKSTCQYLSPKLLETMVAVSKDFRYSVSALVGGEHCKNAKQPGCKGISNHYAGQAFDVNYIYDNNGNKMHVAPKDGNSYNFMKACLQAGFTDVIGPNPLPKGAKNNKQHNNHIHCGFK